MNKFLQIATTPRSSLKEQTLFAKRLSFLINANVPLVEGLGVLRGQVTSRGHAKMLDQVIGDIENGQSLAKSFSKFPKMFGNFAVHIIKIGEASGTLSQNLQYLADELKKRHALRRKVVGAFVYPALISLATVGITIFLMVYLFPKIMPIFSSLRIELPVSTRIVMALSNFLREWGVYAFGVAVVVLVAATLVVRHNKWLTYQFHNLMMRLPILGSVVRSFNISNGSRTLGLLLKSGVKLSEALTITADTTHNAVYKKHFMLLEETVNRGEKISNHMRKNTHVFPHVFGHLVAVGETSGTLSDSLVYLSELYDNEVDDFTKNLSTLIEPVLMVAMGLVVGFIAVSIITPIYGITQNLKN